MARMDWIVTVRRARFADTNDGLLDVVLIRRDSISTMGYGFYVSLEGVIA